MHIYIYIYIYKKAVYKNKKPVCVYVLHKDKKNKKRKVCLTNYRFHLILNHACEWYNLYDITNILTRVPRGNFTKEPNNS